MVEGGGPEEFPDVGNKLTAPKKLSAFEKERQAAQAKEKRAEAENAAALKAFEDSFAEGGNDDDDDDDFLSRASGGRGASMGPRGPGFGYGGPPGRYGMNSGPVRGGRGSLEPPLGLGPPSLKRKRALDETREAQEARREQEMLAFEDTKSDSKGTSHPILHDSEQDVDAPRSTIQLSSLPPTMSTEDVITLLGDQLTVHSIRFLPPAGPGSNVKRTLSAIATLSSDVSTEQIDTAVSGLKERYLGCGYYLSISRHLSSAALHPSVTTNIPASSSEPFGAEKPRDPQARFSMRNAPPPTDQRSFAPPQSYETSARYDTTAQPDAIVSVHPPLGIEAVKAVHTVVDNLLLEPDPGRALALEAMLMALPEVQRDERFAFLYDSRSPAGLYYRFMLWASEDSDEATREMKRRTRGPEKVHEDVAIDWLPPYADVPFPDLKSLAQVVTDMDYISSDEESDDEEAERKFNLGREGESGPELHENKHLTPLQRARLVHLLSRLPTSNARLRKGDVARITNFSVNHAGQGAEAIVDLLLLNVDKPLSYSMAAEYEDTDQEQDEEDIYEPDEELAILDPSALPAQKDGKREDDPSNAKLIALYVISDILSASSTAGARNAWKYRQLFESGFKALKTFERLGRLDKDLAWGRLKAEQWKRKIGVVFGIWEGWSVFGGDVLAEFKQCFFEPPMSEREKAAVAVQETEEKKQQQQQVDALMGRFKRIGSAASPNGSTSPAPASFAAAPAVDKDDDGAPLDDIDGQPLEEGVDGEPMADDLDGIAMDDVDGQPIGGLDGATEDAVPSQPPEDKVSISMLTPKPEALDVKPSGPRRRMRAEDMFADSDDE